MLTLELRLQRAIAAILCTGWSSDRISAMNMFNAPSFKMASPCSKFAARFPRARAASLETSGDEDPSAFSVKMLCCRRFKQRGGGFCLGLREGIRGGCTEIFDHVQTTPGDTSLKP